MQNSILPHGPRGDAQPYLAPATGRRMRAEQGVEKAVEVIEEEKQALTLKNVNL